MIKFGSQFLNSVTPQAAAWIATHAQPSDSYYFSYSDWPGPGNRSSWHFPPRTDPRPVKLGTLQWPLGAQRWSTYHGLVDDDTLRQIRTECYGNPSGGNYRPLDLIIKDEAVNAASNEVKTKMFMLPPRPLAQCPVHIPGIDREMYLLTLVDVRYFWHYESKEINVTEGTTTWDGLISSIGTALGITIKGDAVESVYLNPPAILTSKYESIPQLLDAVAHAVGRRVVRDWKTGDVLLQKPAHLAGDTSGEPRAKQEQDRQVTKWPRFGGGLFAFVAGRENDLEGNVPRAVDVIFPRSDNGQMTGEVHRVSTTLRSLNLDYYRGITGFDVNDDDADEARIIHSYAVAGFTGGATPANAAQLNSLAQRIARDYYLWHLGRQHQLYAGIVPYKPEGYAEVIEWCHTKSESYTKVMRSPWEGEVQEMPASSDFGSHDVGKDCCCPIDFKVCVSGYPAPMRSNVYQMVSGYDFPVKSNDTYLMISGYNFPVKSGSYSVVSGNFPFPIKSGSWQMVSCYPFPVVSNTWITLSNSYPIPIKSNHYAEVSNYPFPIPVPVPVASSDTTYVMTSGYPFPVPIPVPLESNGGLFMVSNYPFPIQIPIPIASNDITYQITSGYPFPVKSGPWQMVSGWPTPILSGGLPSFLIGSGAIVSGKIASGSIGSGDLHADLLGGGGEGPLFGSGTIDRLAKWVSGNFLSDSQITDDGSSVSADIIGNLTLEFGAAGTVGGTAGASTLLLKAIAGVTWGASGDAIAAYGATPVTQQTVTGNRSGNAALADLLTKLDALGIIVDGTT